MQPVVQMQAPEAAFGQGATRHTPNVLSLGNLQTTCLDISGIYSATASVNHEPRRVITMPNALCQGATTPYRSLFPDWSPARPMEFFMMENLLEARRDSQFPTNFQRPDEDVNIYVAHLLAAFFKGQHGRNISMGATPVLNPPSKSILRRNRAEYYRQNADHRLIMLGLFDRGDHERKTPLLFGSNHQQTRETDISVGANCYKMAVNLLENRNSATGGLVDVWGKLSEDFGQYVQVISTMAVQKLGLGAQLNTGDLISLLKDAPSIDSTSPREKAPQMDHLLDLLLEIRQKPHAPQNQQKRAKVIDLAHKLNLDPEKLFRQAG